MAKRMSTAAKAALEAIKENDIHTAVKSTSEFKRELNEAAAAAEEDAYRNSNAYKREKAIKERREYKNNLQSYMLEGWLDRVFTQSLGNRACIISEDTKALNKSLIKGFIQEEGADYLLKEMGLRSNMLATVAKFINEEVDEQMEEYDESEDKNPCINSDIRTNLYTKLDGSEEFDDVSDTIHQRVSQATQNFIQKNMVDKLNIKELMNNTKEKIDAIRTGDDETDEIIKQEQTIKMKRGISEISNRPHSIYEQIVMNLTEAVLKNDKAKEKFTTENGRLDMDSIVERATSFYTMLEMVNTLHLKEMSHEYIQNMISMK